MSQEGFPYTINYFNAAAINTEEFENICLINFSSRLSATISLLKEKDVKAIFFSICEDKPDLIPLIMKQGFSFHTVLNTSLILFKKLKPCIIPPPMTHTIGGGAIVFNPGLKKVLLVKEATGPVTHFWKIPTGRLEGGESIRDGILRELYEELGITGQFLGLISFRDTHPMTFNANELFFTGVVVADAEKFKMCETELSDAKWMDLEEYSDLDYPHFAYKFLMSLMKKLGSSPTIDDLKNMMPLEETPVTMFVDSHLKKFSYEHRPKNI